MGQVKSEALGCAEALSAGGKAGLEPRFPSTSLKHGKGDREKSLPKVQAWLHLRWGQEGSPAPRTGPVSLGQRWGSQGTESAGDLSQDILQICGQTGSLLLRPHETLRGRKCIISQSVKPSTALLPSVMTEAHPGRKQQVGEGPPHESRILGWLLIWKEKALAQLGLAMAFSWHTAAGQAPSRLRGCIREEVALTPGGERSRDQPAGGKTKCGLSIQWNRIPHKKE